MSTLSDRGAVRLAIDGSSALKVPLSADVHAVTRLAARYDEDYYERGVEKGISGYSNYRWIPELTVPMAMTLIDTMGIGPGQRVLDFGCAKGFTVKALRMLRRDAHGIDISEYAISQVPHDVKAHCELVEELGEYASWHRYAHVIAKDVLEHVPQELMDETLGHIAQMGESFLAVVPLGTGGDGAKYVIDAYERDVTHVIREPALWWCQAISRHYRDVTWRHHIDGIKDNWFRVDPLGNAAILARGPRCR